MEWLFTRFLSRIFLCHFPRPRWFEIMHYLEFERPIARLKEQIVDAAEARPRRTPNHRYRRPRSSRLQPRAEPCGPITYARLTPPWAARC